MLLENSSRLPPPVAFRIVRPYSHEDALIAAESYLFSPTSITLVGACHKPQGVVLRFELTLSNGTSLFYGEGRVVHYEASTSAQPSLLTLRIVRLDEQSKIFLDKVLSYQKKIAQSEDSIEQETSLFDPESEMPPTTLRSPSSDEENQIPEITQDLERRCDFKNDVDQNAEMLSKECDGFEPISDLSTIHNKRMTQSVEVLEPYARQNALARLRSHRKNERKSFTKF